MWPNCHEGIFTIYYSITLGIFFEFIKRRWRNLRSIFILDASSCFGFGVDVHWLSLLVENQQLGTNVTPKISLILIGIHIIVTWRSPGRPNGGRSNSCFTDSLLAKSIGFTPAILKHSRQFLIKSRIKWKLWGNGVIFLF